MTPELESLIAGLQTQIDAIKTALVSHAGHLDEHTSQIVNHTEIMVTDDTVLKQYGATLLDHEARITALEAK